MRLGREHVGIDHVGNDVDFFRCHRTSDVLGVNGRTNETFVEPSRCLPLESRNGPTIPGVYRAVEGILGETQFSIEVEPEGIGKIDNARNLGRNRIRKLSQSESIDVNQVDPILPEEVAKASP